LAQQISIAFWTSVTQGIRTDTTARPPPRIAADMLSDFVINQSINPGFLKWSNQYKLLLGPLEREVR